MPFDEVVAAPVATDVTDVSSDASIDPGTSGESIDPATAGSDVDLPIDPGASAGEVSGDGRQIPPALRAQLDQLKGSDPKLATRIKDVWFADLAFKKEFPGGLNEARALREFQDRLGGEDGYKQIEAERQSYKDLDAQFAAGDAKAIEHLAAVAPEGLAKLITPALVKLSESHPEQFNHLAARITLNSLPVDLLGSIYSILEANKTDPGIASLSKQLADWFNPLQQLAGKAPEKKVDPDRQKFEQEKQQFESNKTAEFQRGIVGEIEQDGGAQADKIIDQLSGGKLSTEAKTRLKGVITTELNQALLGDHGFVQKRDRLLAEGDRNKIVTNYKSEIGKRLPEIVKKVHREFYGVSKAATKPNVDVGTGRGAQPGKQPDASTIDWTRTTRRDVLDGKAYVKGQTAQVSW